MPGWGPDQAVTIKENCTAVTSIRPYRNAVGFQWELYLMGDQPFLVDSMPRRPERPSTVFSGEQRVGVSGGIENAARLPKHALKGTAKMCVEIALRQKGDEAMNGV